MAAGERAPVLRPMKQRRAFEEIAGQIRSRLAGQGLRAGDRLPAERELAEHFRVSRNTLREALRSLEIAGLLELRKGAAGGAFIREGGGDAVITGLADLFHLGRIQPEHLTEARTILGAEVARLACERRTAADLEKLRANVAQAQQASDAGRIDERAELNYQFHSLLARATRNPVLIIVTDALMAMTRHFIETIGNRPNTYVMPSRRRLLRRLEERDGAGAAREMKWMLRRLQREHLARYEKSGRAKSMAKRKRPGRE